jgi:phage terminase large subunit
MLKSLKSARVHWPTCSGSGIDFGFRNPFAAVWGVVDRDDVLWLTGEHYQHERPLSYHIEKIPRGVDWYADPSEPGDITELRVAGFTVNPGRNAIRPGIAAVSARLENGTLRIVQDACPNLVGEAELYRYATESGSRRAETPQDNNDHALDALRYLIATIDQRKLGRKPKIAGGAAGEKDKPAGRPWLRLDNEALWTRIW